MENDYGMCARCNQPLTDYQLQFDRRVERMEYHPLGHSDFKAIVTVLYAEELACYCSTDCSSIGVQKELQDRSIINTGGSIGPVTSCAKCRAVIDMTQPYVHYEKMAVTVNKKPWLTSLTVLDSESLADVCINCDPDGVLLAVTQQSESIANTVVQPVTRALTNIN